MLYIIQREFCFQKQREIWPMFRRGRLLHEGVFTFEGRRNEIYKNTKTEHDEKDDIVVRATGWNES